MRAKLLLFFELSGIVATFFSEKLAGISINDPAKFQTMMNEVFANNLPARMQEMTFGVNHL